MRETAAKTLTWIGYGALLTAAIYAVVLVATQANAEYGWLGACIAVALLVPFFWLLPLVGWFFLPATQLIWLFVFLAIFIAAAAGASSLREYPAR